MAANSNNPSLTDIQLQCANNHNYNNDTNNHANNNSDSAGANSPRLHILLCVSGSVATVKIYELVESISLFADVRVVTTEKAKYFYDLHKLSGLCQIYTDSDEWTKANNNNNNGYTRGDSI